MNENLSSRERVQKALNHQEPDRVPLGFGGAPSFLTDEVYFKLKRHLGISGDVTPFRIGHTCNIFDQRIVEKLDGDYRFIQLKPPQTSLINRIDISTVIDEWGVKLQMINGYGVRMSKPLANARDVSDIKKHRWPRSFEIGSVEGLKEKAKDLFQNTDKFIVARAPFTSSFMEVGGYLRGPENFLADLILNKSLASALLDKLLEVQSEVYDMFLSAVGPWVQEVEMAEDYGTQGGLLISPSLFREMIKPRRRQIIELIKRKAPQAKVFHHSCGGIYEIIEDLIEIGVDILNPIQPLAKGMDSFRLKREFGDRICFDGGFDMIKAMPGSPDDIEKEVRRCMKGLASGGGYIFNTSNIVQRDTPPDNVVLTFKLAKKLGKYPINV